MSSLTSFETIRALLVDDEKAVRSALREILHQNFPAIQVVGEAASIPEAVREIHTHNPTLIFLDIEMPGYSGLQLVEFFNPQEINFDIIFVTAFNEYAIQAFKISAFDYLLKPVNTLDLEQTLSRYAGKVQKQKIVERVKLLKESYTHEKLPAQIAVSFAQGIDFVQLENIITLEASGTYTTIRLKEGSSIIASKPLGEFETLLQNHTSFFRAHRSYIINLKYVRKFSNKEGDVIILLNELEVPLSRYRKKEFESAIAEFRI
ncbi:MAG: LytTR family DNA-binding domain-containing protein [Cyclobacteriaceae bacterium]|nr:LytTR family DNA-binding domain-containing protein [Cytophagales bacterium]MCZ8328716.1 LytTR family DNA-binding domain-containing protein [Cyclobacteriaceae bacterium]MCZ8355019.1 LytTR family DNA-binding domain-containing protein [Cyclobacteriaceae bacterium]